MPDSPSLSTSSTEPLRFSHQVRTFETDAHGRLTPSALLNLLQYAAGRHAELLGWSVRSLHENSQTWVLQRFYCDIKALPQDNERVHITTYPSGAERVLAYRDYKVEDEQGRRLVDATSSWVILDLNSRRVQPVPEHVAALGKVFGSRITSFPAGRLSAFDITGRFPRASFRIRRHDLDLNRHVNNVRYMEWGMESVPHDVFEQPLAEMDIVFKAECFFGDSVDVFCQGDSPGKFRHVLRRRSDEKIVCLMNSRWKLSSG